MSSELEELSWITIHGRGVLNTGQASLVASILAEAGFASGRESYFYMRYDDAPERVNLPFIYYVVYGNPRVRIVLPEEVEPVGNIFDVVVVLDSSILLQPTSQRALLLDGAKKKMKLVVNTSLSPDSILELIKKYQCAHDWEGSIITIKAKKYDPNISIGMIGATLKAIEDKVSIDNVFEALEAKENTNEKIKAVTQAYEEAKLADVKIKAKECEPYKLISEMVEKYKKIPSQALQPWNRETYESIKKRASDAPTYELRIKSIRYWEVLAPGLIEFNPKPREKNIGYKTSFFRSFRPVCNKNLCVDCKLCHIYCPEGAIDFETNQINYDYCKGCGICANVCGRKAITMVSEVKALEDLDEEEKLTIREALIEYMY